MEKPTVDLAYNLNDKENYFKTHRFVWTIQNVYRFVPHQYPQFRSTRINDSRPQLKLDLKGRQGDVVELSCLFPTAVLVSIQVNLDSVHEDTEFKPFCFLEANKWFHIKTWHKKLIKRYLADPVNPRMNFKFTLQFKMFDETNVKTHDLFKLSDDFRNTLKAGFLSDYVLKSSGNKKYKVHKAILAGRSVVFRDSFNKGTTDTLLKFDSEVIEEVLSYIYSNKVSRLAGIPTKLLAAANYYKLDGLKTMCEEELSRGLQVENVMEMLKISKIYNAFDLEKAASNYVLKMTHLHKIYMQEDCTALNILTCPFISLAWQ